MLAIDNNESLHPDVVASVLALPIKPYPADLFWASPPCLEYSRYDQPWFKPKVEPDLTLYRATLNLIASWQPRWWIIENVRGAIRWWGKPAAHYGSHYLWSNLLLLPIVQIARNHKYYVGSKAHRTQERAKIPYPLSLALAELIESFG